MRITVVIPLYNKQDTIQRALQSVFTQTVQPEEIIVVNDGSSDGSEKVVESMYHQLVKLIHQPNAGVSSARNFGIKEAKGDWIAFLDADDFWDIDFLETIMDLNTNYPEARVIMTAYKYFYENEVSYPILFLEPDAGILKNYFKAAYRGSPPIWTGAVCIERIALLKIGLFPENVRIGEDLLTWARLAVHFEIAYTSKCKSNYCFPTSIEFDQKFRLPDSNDYVGKELKKMLLNNTNKHISKDLKKYISHWHKMRLQLYIFSSMRNKSLSEYLKCIQFNIFNYKAHLLMFYNFLPGFIKRVIAKKGVKFSFK